MVYEKPTAILAWLLEGEAFRELLVYALLSKWQTLPELLTKQFFKNTIFVKATK